MSEINSAHDEPVHWASVGYRRIALMHPHTGPHPGPPNQLPSPRTSRRIAKAQARARKREVRAGVPFLQSLTRVSNDAGTGAWQGERAPSRLAGKLRFPYGGAR